jgi:HAMP domain-containing protein
MQGIGSFIANCRIGSKIAIGFAAVLLILAVSSTFAYLAFGRVASAVDGYAELVATSAIYRDIDLTVAQYRGHVREYVVSDNEDTAEMAVKEGTALPELIAKGLARVTNLERHGLLEDMAKQAESYTTHFAHVRDMNREQAKLEAEVLDVVGQQMTDGFSSVLAGATKAGNTDILPLVVEGRRLSLTARLDVNKRLGRHDESAAKSAEQQFDELKRTSAQLDTATKGSELNSSVASETKLIDSYQSAFRHAVSLDTEQTAQVNGVMRQAGDAMQADAIKAKDSNFAAQGETERDMQAVVSRGNTLVMILGLAGLAVGVALAWLIGRGISRPVVGMCAAMRALAGGDKSVQIPGVGRKDEIGQMADTVAVFRDNMVEADRLREDNERHKAEAEAARKAGMIRLADTFEAGIKGVVNSVASQATEMQSAAQAMTHTAETATQQATAVAASVEQASANVQTVATASEELSASVLEIGRQVEQ